MNLADLGLDIDDAACPNPTHSPQSRSAPSPAKQRETREPNQASEAVVGVDAAPVETVAIGEIASVDTTDVGPDSDADVDAAETAHGFDGLGLSESVSRALREGGYNQPTPIQAEIIPQLVAGRDVVAQSETGSGKTAAFALPILSRLTPGEKNASVLVLTPTRELAIQVAKAFKTYARAMQGFHVLAIYGGQDYEPQLRALRRGVDVIVGTPGRVIDHIRRGTLDPSELTTLVLDEADEMLNMGFMEDVEFVLSRIAPARQIALFSATMPGPIRKIAEGSLRDPARVTIKSKTMTAESIRQRAIFSAPRDKFDLLCRVLESEPTDGVIVFTKTKDATLTVAEQLGRRGFSAVALNGDMPQAVRERTVAGLKSGKLDVLVATDVAARGLDVQRVSHVINFDLPHDSEAYVHRVGRTGRAGRTGTAYLFLSRGQRHRLRAIEQVTRGKIEIVDPPSTQTINNKRVERFEASITELTAAEDLTFYKNLVAEYAEKSGKPIEMIAAALARLSQGGEPFFVQDAPKPTRAFDSPDRGGDRPQGRRGGPPQPGRDRFRVAVGSRDGVQPKHLVGAIASEAGLTGAEIGPIRIFESFALVDLPAGMPRDIYETLRQTRVVGRPLRLTRSDEGERREFRGGRPHGKSGGRPQGKSKPRGKSKPGFKKRSK